MHTLNRAGATPAEERFPNLFRLTMDVLPAQASTVPCARLFSSGKRLPPLAATKFSQNSWKLCRCSNFPLETAHSA